MSVTTTDPRTVARARDLGPKPSQQLVARAQLRCRPIARAEAAAWLRTHHRHLPPPVGWLFGVAVERSGDLVHVAVLGRPTARALQDGRTAEVTRCASPRGAPTTPHAASMALAALTRAATALGYTRVVSYTRADERGTTYRAAGWRPTAVTSGGEWSRPSRRRGPAAQPIRKVRWETGPAAAPAIALALPTDPPQEAA